MNLIPDTGKLSSLVVFEVAGKWSKPIHRIIKAL
jgi:hypothetical protein